MSSWIRHAFRRGIITSRYPARPPSPEEMPATGGAPSASADALAHLPAEVRDRCPTGAIEPDRLDQGKCVRCARCFSAGLVPIGTPSASVGARAELRWTGGRPPSPPATADGPLAPLGRSVHIFLIDVGSCQACNLEVLGLSNPYYDLHRLGLFFTNSPRHADVLVVVGVPTPEMVEPLRRTYEAMPGPKAVLAVGACAIDGGIFERSPRRASTVGEIVPVDRYVAGCPPPPLTVLEGLLELGRQAPAVEGERR